MVIWLAMPYGSKMVVPGFSTYTVEMPHGILIRKSAGFYENI